MTLIIALNEWISMLETGIQLAKSEKICAYLIYSWRKRLSNKCGYLIHKPIRFP